DMTKAFDYYIGLIDKDSGIELVRDGLTHRSLDDKTDTYYDISYEGFALVDDLLSYLNDGNLKVDGLTYYDNFKAKEEPAGYYFLEGYSLFLDNDKNVKLATGSTVYTGKWSKDNNTLTLDIKSFSNDPIKANIVDGELEFDADVFG
ncbi:MAG: zinc ribbon domain-containing protein, partial [Anaerococcus prevotii]|nr:zinc ribbon domain-containing protein [Anaerococcus prevotii]